MTIRHKAKKVSLSTGLVSEWNDDHHADFEDELLSSWNFVSTNLFDEFTTATNKTGVVDISMVNNHNFCNLTTGADNAAYARLILGDADVTNKLDLPIFTTALKLETSDKLEFGFFVHANTPFTANQKGAYFRVTGGKLYAVTGKGDAETVTEIGDVIEYSQYKIEFTSSDVRFYTEDLRTLRATHTTNITTDDLTVKFCVDNPNGVGEIMRVDALALMRLRKK